MEFLVLAVLIGLIPAAIAQSKGYSFILWWIFGVALFIVALPVALIMKPDAAAIEQSKLRERMKKCPFCAELIKLEANVCRYCGRELDHSCRTIKGPRPEPQQVQVPLSESEPQQVQVPLPVALVIIAIVLSVVLGAVAAVISR